MLMAYGFLRKIFEVFEKCCTPIDMVTTSEVAVSITIDSEEKLEEITTDLEAFGVIAVQKNQTIVTIVGNEIMQTNEMMRRLFNAINEIPVSMVSYGGSKHNVSLLIPAEFKAITLKALNKGLFDL